MCRNKHQMTIKRIPNWKTMKIKVCIYSYKICILFFNPLTLFVHLNGHPWAAKESSIYIILVFLPS
jgi:hypothetical protein